MPVNITDVSTFTSPVTAPAGGDVRDSASVVTPIQDLSNRTRYLKDLHDATTGVPLYLGGQTFSRRLQVHPGHFGIDSSGIAAWFRPSALAARVESRIDVANLWIPVDDIAPHALAGANAITQVTTRWKPGSNTTTRNGGANSALSIGVYEGTISGSTVNWALMGSLVTQGNVTADETKIANGGGGGYAITSGRYYAVRIVGGFDSGSNHDIVYGLEVEYFTAGVSP